MADASAPHASICHRTRPRGARRHEWPGSEHRSEEDCTASSVFWISARARRVSRTRAVGAELFSPELAIGQRPTTVRDWLTERAGQVPDRVALVADGKTWTYSELDTR